MRAAVGGHTPLDPRIAGMLLPGQQPPPAADLLSDREKQVLRLAGTQRPVPLQNRFVH